MTVGGLRGGMSEDNMDTLLNLAVEFGVNDIKVEANMGHGVVSALMMGHCEKKQIKGMLFEDYYAKGQKERRIIDTISPLTRRHKLIVHARALEDDHNYSMLHARDKRTVTSAFYQLANITYDRGSLSCDDRADCIQGVVMFLGALLSVDDEKEAIKRRAEVGKGFAQNPMGYNAPKQQGNQHNRTNINSRFKRRG
jgi:hypothetical protein